MTTPNEPTPTLRVLIPTYEDWAAAAALLARLDAALAGEGWRADVLVVDDGSVVAAGPRLVPPAPAALARLRVLRLRRNLGHQRAIAIGLAVLAEEVRAEEVRAEEGGAAPLLVMDGDGEDDPADALTLLRRFAAEGGAKVVFAGRARRSEGLAFRAGYQAFKLVHRVLTGHRVRVGNFSVLPAGALGQLAVAAETWNHYAAAVYKLRLPREVVPVPRSARLAGASRMNLVDLVAHGLSAISVFGEVVGVRLLLAAGALTALAAGGLAATAASPPPWPWLPAALALGLVLSAQAACTSAAFVLLVLSGRGGATFLPARDHPFFHEGPRRLHPPDGPAP
ncbi:MAG: glycosyltransferase [Planctomycetes bacterium]|nr:glycosyltransferase [Planctomycetota bacterium]